MSTCPKDICPTCGQKILSDREREIQEAAIKAAEARRECNYAELMEMACSGEDMRIKAHKKYIELLNIATDAEIVYAELKRSTNL